MNIQLDPRQLATMDTTDERNARIIALLIFTAKTMQRVSPFLAGAQKDSTSVLPALSDFMTYTFVNHGDGLTLEQEVLALASEMGLIVDLRHLSPEAHA